MFLVFVELRNPVGETKALRVRQFCFGNFSDRWATHRKWLHTSLRTGAMDAEFRGGSADALGNATAAPAQRA